MHGRLGLKILTGSIWEDVLRAGKTPVKQVKGESQLLRDFNKAADDLFSKAVSRIRQSIEELFN